MKQTGADVQHITLTVRVSRDTADALRAIAERDHRPVAAEMRRLIELHVAANDKAAA